MVSINMHDMSHHVGEYNQRMYRSAGEAGGGGGGGGDMPPRRVQGALDLGSDHGSEEEDTVGCLSRFWSSLEFTVLMCLGLCTLIKLRFFVMLALLVFVVGVTWNMVNLFCIYYKCLNYGTEDGRGPK